MAQMEIPQPSNDAPQTQPTTNRPPNRPIVPQNDDVPPEVLPHQPNDQPPNQPNDLPPNQPNDLPPNVPRKQPRRLKNHCGWLLNSIVFSKVGINILGALCVFVLVNVFVVYCFPEDSTLRDDFLKVNHAVAIGLEDLKNATAHLLTSLLSYRIWKDESAFTKNHHHEVKKEAVLYTKPETEPTGSDTAAALKIIKSLSFSVYKESNLCDLMEGIPLDVFDETVDEIAELTNLPENLRKRIKRAKSLQDGSAIAVNKLHFISKEGGLVFGRVGVVRRGDVMDMAYSLHSLVYQLSTTQSSQKNAKTFGSFWKSGNNDEKADLSKGISVELRNGLESFFQTQAIKGFTKHCGYVLKTMKNYQVLQAMGVRKDGENVKQQNNAQGNN